MSTIIFDGRNDRFVNSNLSGHDIYGIVINYANILGWPHGFDGEFWGAISWQIHEAGLERPQQNKTDEFWVQFSIPEDLGSKAPFTGVASVMDGVASRLNWEHTDSYSFAIDTEHVNLQYPEGSSVFELISRDKATQARISISIPRDSNITFPKNFLNSPSFGSEDLISNTTILDHKTLVHNSTIPEYQDIEWQNVVVFDSLIREWSPVAAGVLAGILAFNLASDNIKCPTLIRIAKRRAPAATRL